MASRAAAILLKATPSPPLPSQANPPKPGAASLPAPLSGRTTRRTAAAAALAAAFLAGAAALPVQKPARAFELGFTAPDQTPEEAEAGIKIHSRGVLQLRQLVESQAWRELQLALRESSSLLKQDLYTIIQTKPGAQRPLLRKLYSDLFYYLVSTILENFLQMDYAARSKDAGLVQEHYQTVVATLEEILGMI